MSFDDTFDRLSQVPVDKHIGSISAFETMLSLFVSGACGFASVKVDPLCAACQIKPDEIAVPGGTYSDLTPAGKEIMKRCAFAVFKECLADGLDENSFCKTVVSESAALGWTEAEDHEHDKALECALTSAAPR